MKKVLVFLALLLSLSSCGILANPVTESSIAIPEEWHGYYSPNNDGHRYLMKFYKLDSQNLYVKEVGYRADTGSPYSLGGGVYAIKELKTDSPGLFEATFFNTLDDDNFTFAFAIHVITNKPAIGPMTIKTNVLPISTITDDQEGFDNFTNNTASYEGVVYSATNEAIPSIPPFDFDPDADKNHFLTKLNGNKTHEYWSIASPILQYAGGLSTLLALIDMSVDSKVVTFNQSLYTNGIEYINQHSPFPAYGLAYRNEKWSATDGHKNPDYVVHFEPGPAGKEHKYGILWAKTPLNIGMVPTMIVEDFMITGWVVTIGKNSTPDQINEAFQKLDWEFFETTPMAELLLRSHAFTRVKNAPTLTHDMPFVPGYPNQEFDPLK